MKIENVIFFGVSSLMAASLMVACGPKARPGSEIKTKTPVLQRAQQDQQKAAAERLAKMNDAEKKKSLELAQSIVGIDINRTKDAAQVDITLQKGSDVSVVSIGPIELKGGDGKNETAAKGAGESSDKKMKVELSCTDCSQAINVDLSENGSKVFASAIVKSLPNAGLKVHGIEDKYADKAGAADIKAIRGFLSEVAKSATVRFLESDITDISNLAKSLKTVVNFSISGTKAGDKEAQGLSLRTVINGEAVSMTPSKPATGVFQKVEGAFLIGMPANRLVKIETGKGSEASEQLMEVRTRDEKADVIEIKIVHSEAEKLAAEIETAKADVAAKQAALEAAKTAQGQADQAVTAAKAEVEKAGKGTDEKAKDAAQKALEKAQKTAADAKVAVDKAQGELTEAQTKLKELEAKVAKK